MKPLSTILIIFFMLEQITNACAVCGFGQDGSTGAYILTTAILTFVPLGMIGGVVWVIYRRANLKS